MRRRSLVLLHFTLGIILPSLGLCSEPDSLRCATLLRNAQAWSQKADRLSALRPETLALEMEAQTLRQQAADVYRSIVDECGGQAIAYQQLAMLQILLGDPTAAGATLEEAFEAGHRTPGILRGAADLARTGGRWNDAIMLYEEILASDSPLDADRAAYAHCLVSAGRLDEAGRVLTALSLSGHGPGYPRLRASASFKAGEPILDLPEPEPPIEPCCCDETGDPAIGVIDQLLARYEEGLLHPAVAGPAWAKVALGCARQLVQQGCWEAAAAFCRSEIHRTEAYSLQSDLVPHPASITANLRRLLREAEAEGRPKPKPKPKPKH